MPKLNLITEPDKLHNENISVLLINPAESVKHDFNQKAKQFEKDLNVYMFEVKDPDYQQNLKWLIEVANAVNVIVFDINGTFKDRWLIGYMLNKTNCYYIWNGSSAFEFNLINNNRVYDLEFLPSKIKELENK